MVYFYETKELLFVWKGKKKEQLPFFHIKIRVITSLFFTTIYNMSLSHRIGIILFFFHFFGHTEKKVV